MTVEVAPVKYWLYDSSLDVANMHCFCLDVNGTRGWRLPTNDESTDLITIAEREYRAEIPKELHEFTEYWHDDNKMGFWTIDDYDDDSWDEDDAFTVIPVRDVL